MIMVTLAFGYRFGRSLKISAADWPAPMTAIWYGAAGSGRAEVTWREYLEEWMTRGCKGGNSVGRLGIPPTAITMFFAMLTAVFPVLKSREVTRNWVTFPLGERISGETERTSWP